VTMIALKYLLGGAVLLTGTALLLTKKKREPALVSAPLDPAALAAIAALQNAPAVGIPNPQYAKTAPEFTLSAATIARQKRTSI
jgi:hypothetical protein